MQKRLTQLLLKEELVVNCPLDTLYYGMLDSGTTDFSVQKLKHNQLKFIAKHFWWEHRHRWYISNLDLNGTLTALSNKQTQLSLHSTIRPELYAIIPIFIIHSLLVVLIDVSFIWTILLYPPIVSLLWVLSRLDELWLLTRVKAYIRKKHFG